MFPHDIKIKYIAHELWCVSSKLNPWQCFIPMAMDILQVLEDEKSLEEMQRRQGEIFGGLNDKMAEKETTGF